MRESMYEYLNALIDGALYSIQRVVNKDAKQLILGTIAIESDFGKHRRQLGGGGALGICQIERPTFNWLKDVYKDRLPFIKAIEFEDLEYNDFASIVFCRLRYLVVPYPLPPSTDVELMAAYYKRHYNTYLGAATKEDFVAKYNRYIGVHYA